MAHPERFIAAYLTTWTGYIQTHSREVLALVRIYNAFRDETGRPNPAFDVRASDITAVAQVLRHGQETGRLGRFDPRTMAAVMAATQPDHGPAANSVPASRQATPPRPVDLVTLKEEK
jgi:hypothetical protein